MTYVYRDPQRARRRPVHDTERQPEPAQISAVEQPARRTKRQRQQPNLPLPRRTLPPPIYGGRTGLHFAAEESAALDRRTRAMIAAGHDSPWIREFKRIHNIK